MNRVILFMLLCLFIPSLMHANDPEMFAYDSEQLDQEMAQLQDLEEYIAENPGVSLTGLLGEENYLLDGLEISSCVDGGIYSMSGGLTLGIPSFLWGCCLGPIGVLIVYLVKDERSETRKAFWGCITWGTIIFVYQIIYYALGTAY